MSRRLVTAGGATLGVAGRATWTASVALVAATALAWIGLAGYEAPMGLGGFLAAWTLMMTAMMLPSTAPLVLLYRGRRALVALGYLGVSGAPSDCSRMRPWSVGSSPRRRSCSRWRARTSSAP